MTHPPLAGTTQDMPASFQVKRIDPYMPQHIRSALNHWFGDAEARAQTHPAAVFLWEPLILHVHDITSTMSIAHEEALGEVNLWTVYGSVFLFPFQRNLRRIRL